MKRLLLAAFIAAACAPAVAQDTAPVQLGARACVNGNIGSGSVQEMSDWMACLTADSPSPLTVPPASVVVAAVTGTATP